MEGTERLERVTALETTTLMPWIKEEIENQVARQPKLRLALRLIGLTARMFSISPPPGTGVRRLSVKLLH
jgi:hypothetical protein